MVKEQCWLNETISSYQWVPEGLETGQQDEADEADVTEDDLQAVLKGMYWLDDVSVVRLNTVPSRHSNAAKDSCERLPTHAASLGPSFRFSGHRCHITISSLITVPSTQNHHVRSGATSHSGSC